MFYCRVFAKLPIIYTYKNKNGQIIICDHCGATPGKDAKALQDRSHFLDKWPDDCENIYMVHGHTPVEYLLFRYGYWLNPKHAETTEQSEIQMPDTALPEPPRVLRYCDGHKFDIDLGSVANGRTVLLDLDTFEEIYFEDKNEQNE